MKKIITILLSIFVMISFIGCENKNAGCIIEIEDKTSEAVEEKIAILEDEAVWYQQITDENLKNAKYMFDQDLTSALEAPCVVLYKDNERGFALYSSFSGDYDEMLIVSNGKKTAVKACCQWDRYDFRDSTAVHDLDNDGFEEIIIKAVTGTGTGYYRSAFFIFDSSDNLTYDKLSVCGTDEIIYKDTQYLQDVFAVVDASDGTVLFMQKNEIRYKGHIKNLMESYPKINAVELADYVSAQLTEDGKLFLIATPCFYGDIYGQYDDLDDTEDDVCDIIYEIEYLSDGTLKCVSVNFE